MSENKPNKKNEGIRTFYKDLQKIEKTQGKRGILNAVIKEQQQNHQRSRALKSRKTSSVVWIIVSLVFVIAGALSVVLADKFSKPLPVESGPKLPSLFQVDYNLKLNTTDTEKAQKDLATFSTQNYTSPSMVRIVPESGKILSFKEASSILWPNTPLLVTTTAFPEFVLGYYTTKNVRNPFLVLRARDFSGLKKGFGFWEETIHQDLLIAFNLESEAQYKDAFRDELINNIPVRSLYVGSTIEQSETIRTPVILPLTEPEKEATNTNYSIDTKQVATNTENTPTTTTETLPTEETEQTKPEVKYVEETITTIVPGPEKRVLFYTLVNGTYAIVATNPETLREIVNRLAQQ